MIKLFSSVNVIKNFKLQKKEKNDESLRVHLESMNIIKSAFEDDFIIGLYDVGNGIIDSDFLSETFYNGIEYVNIYKKNNYRSLYNFCKLYEDYCDLRDDLPNLLNNRNTNGYIITRVNGHDLGISEPFVPIYKKKDDKIFLLGQYIYGYVPITPSKTFGNIIFNSSYSIDFGLENKNLLYEALAEFKLKQNGDNSYHNDKSLEELFQMIVDAYIMTVNRFHKKQADYALSLLFEDKVGLFVDEKAKNLLKKYVAYANIKQILATGLNCDSDMSLEELFQIFTEKYSSSEYVKPKVKKLN